MDRVSGMSPKLSGDAPGSLYRRGGTFQRQHAQQQIARSWRSLSGQSSGSQDPVQSGDNMPHSYSREVAAAKRASLSHGPPRSSRDGNPRTQPTSNLTASRASPSSSPQIRPGIPLRTPSGGQHWTQDPTNRDIPDASRGSARSIKEVLQPFHEPHLSVSVVGTRTSSDANGAFTQYEVRVRISELSPESEKRSAQSARVKPRKPVEWHMLRRYKQFVTLQSDLRALAEHVGLSGKTTGISSADSLDTSIGSAPALPPDTRGSTGVASSRTAAGEGDDGALSEQRVVGLTGSARESSDGEVGPRGLGYVPSVSSTGAAAQLDALRALELPPKTFLSSLSRGLIDERKGKLETFLRAAAAVPMAVESNALRRFLDGGNISSDGRQPLLDFLLDKAAAASAPPPSSISDPSHIMLNEGGYNSGSPPRTTASARLELKARSDGPGSDTAESASGPREHGQAAMIAALRLALAASPGGEAKLQSILKSFACGPATSREDQGASEAGLPAQLHLPPSRATAFTSQPQAVQEISMSVSAWRERGESDDGATGLFPPPESIYGGGEERRQSRSSIALSHRSEDRAPLGQTRSNLDPVVGSYLGSQAGLSHSSSRMPKEPRDSITSLPNEMSHSLPLASSGPGKHAGSPPPYGLPTIDNEISAREAPLLAPQHFESNMAALSATLRACARTQAMQGLEADGAISRNAQAKSLLVVPSRAAVDDVTDALLLSLVPGDAERELMRRVSTMLAALTSKVAGGRVFPLGPVPSGAGMAGDRVLLSLFMSPEREVRWVLGASEALLALPEVKVSAARVGGWRESLPGYDGASEFEGTVVQGNLERNIESVGQPSQTKALENHSSAVPQRMRSDARSASSDALLNTSTNSTSETKRESATHGKTGSRLVARNQSKLAPGDRGRSLGQMMILPSGPAASGSMPSSPGTFSHKIHGTGQSLLDLPASEVQRAIVAAAVSEHSSARSTTSSSDRRYKLQGPGWESAGSLHLADRTNLASQHALGAAVEEAIAAVDAMDREQRTLGEHPLETDERESDAEATDKCCDFNNLCKGLQRQSFGKEDLLGLAADEAARAIAGVGASATQDQGQGTNSESQRAGDAEDGKRRHTRGGSFVSSAVGSFTSRERGSFADLADSVAQATGMSRRSGDMSSDVRNPNAVGLDELAAPTTGEHPRFVLRASFGSAASGGTDAPSNAETQPTSGKKQQKYKSKSTGGDRSQDVSAQARENKPESKISGSGSETGAAQSPELPASLPTAPDALPLCQVGHVGITRGEHGRSDSIDTLLDGVRVRVVADDLASLATVAAILRADLALKRTHLFLRSLILLRTWAAHLAPVTTRGAGDAFRQLDLRVFVTLLAWVFARRRTVIAQPLQALAWLLFDCTQLRWDEQAVSIEGAVPIEHIYTGSSAAARGLRVSGEVYSASKEALERKQKAKSDSSAAHQPVDYRDAETNRSDRSSGEPTQKGFVSRTLSASSHGSSKHLADAANTGISIGEIGHRRQISAASDASDGVNGSSKGGGGGGASSTSPGKSSRSSRSRRQRPPPAAGWPAHVRPPHSALDALIDAPWLLQTRLRCQKRSGTNSTLFGRGGKQPTPLKSPLGHRLVIEDPLLPGTNLCEGIRSRDARRIRRAFEQGAALLCPIVLRATAAEVASVVDAQAGAIAGQAPVNGAPAPASAVPSPSSSPPASQSSEPGLSIPSHSELERGAQERRRTRSRSRSRQSSSEPAMAVKALLLTQTLAEDTVAASTRAARDLCDVFDPMWEAASAGPEHLGDFDDLTQMMTSGACLSCRTRQCANGTKGALQQHGPCCPGCAPAIPGHDLAVDAFSESDDASETGREDGTDGGHANGACCDECGRAGTEQQAVLKSCLAASACSAAVRSQEQRQRVLGFDMCCEIERCCASHADDDGVCHKCGKVDRALVNAPPGQYVGQLSGEDGKDLRCRCGCDDNMVMSCCVNGHCQRSMFSSCQGMGISSQAEVRRSSSRTGYDRLGSSLRVVAGTTLLRELQLRGGISLASTGTPQRVQCGIVYVRAKHGATRPSPRELQLAALYSVRVLYRRGRLGGLWGTFFASDPHEVQDQLDYCCMVLDADVTAGALVSLAREVLLEYGSLPVGEVGKHLQEAVPHDGLPALLKERFGGLKRFLEHHPEVFMLGRDHQFNPHVYCRDLVTSDGHNQIAQGKVLRGLGGHRAPSTKGVKDAGSGHAVAQRSSGKHKSPDGGPSTRDSPPSKRKRSRRARKGAPVAATQSASNDPALQQNGITTKGGADAATTPLRLGHAPRYQHLHQGPVAQGSAPIPRTQSEPYRALPQPHNFDPYHGMGHTTPLPPPGVPAQQARVLQRGHTRLPSSSEEAGHQVAVVLDPTAVPFNPRSMQPSHRSTAIGGINWQATAATSAMQQVAMHQQGHLSAGQSPWGPGSGMLGGVVGSTAAILSGLQRDRVVSSRDRREHGELSVDTSVSQRHLGPGVPAQYGGPPQGSTMFHDSSSSAMHSRLREQRLFEASVQQRGLTLSPTHGPSVLQPAGGNLSASLAYDNEGAAHLMQTSGPDASAMSPVSKAWAQSSGVQTQALGGERLGRAIDQASNPFSAFGSGDVLGMAAILGDDTSGLEGGLGQ